MPPLPPAITRCCNTKGFTSHTVIQNNLLFKPGDIDCSEGEGKIPNCLDSLVLVYIHSVFTCTSTNDNATFKRISLIKFKMFGLFFCLQ